HAGPSPAALLPSRAGASFAVGLRVAAGAAQHGAVRQTPRPARQGRRLPPPAHQTIGVGSPAGQANHAGQGPAVRIRLAPPARERAASRTNAAAAGEPPVQVLRVISTLAHELRGPLHALAASSEVLHQDAETL